MSGASLSLELILTTATSGIDVLPSLKQSAKRAGDGWVAKKGYKGGCEAVQASDDMGEERCGC